jgi:hypothetical protein
MRSPTNVGHAVFSDANADGTDPRHPRRKVSGPPESACFEDTFLGLSWDAERFHRHMTRWSISASKTRTDKNPNVQYNLKRLRSAVRGGNVDAANDAIRTFTAAEFVSFCVTSSGVKMPSRPTSTKY